MEQTRTQSGSVAQVMRRRSPIDPPDGCWAVVGAGERGSRVLAELQAVGLPAVGYDLHESPADALAPRTQGEAAAARGEYAKVRFGHVVIAIEEIEDIDLLAVTSRDCETGELNTDYFTGVVATPVRDSAVGPIFPGVGAEEWGTFHSLFSSHNPAVLVLAEAQRASDRDRLAREGAKLAAGYANLLRSNPRRALSFNRHVTGHDRRQLHGRIAVESGDGIGGGDENLGLDLREVLRASEALRRWERAFP